MKGKVQTVLGEIDSSELGKVLPHEHFIGDMEKLFHSPSFFKPYMKDSDLSLQTLGWIRQFPYSHLLNMKFDGPDVQQSLMEEMKRYRSYGGKTIVENTTASGAEYTRQTEFAMKISRETGVHVIKGTGFYVTTSQDADTLRLSEEAMVTLMTNDLTEGRNGDQTGKSGIVGEVGCSWPLTGFEKRSLRAAAEVENTLGCPVMVHPGRDHKAPEEIVRVFTEAGGNPTRLVMGHLDRTLHTNEDILEFAAMKTFLEYDLFGIETSYYQLQEEVNMPSDGQRIQRIQLLIQEGFADRILVSHDIHTRHRLEDYGGHGFSHILTKVVPVMLKRGITNEDIDRILIHNPARWLTFIK